MKAKTRQLRTAKFIIATEVGHKKFSISPRNIHIQPQSWQMQLKNKFLKHI